MSKKYKVGYTAGVFDMFHVGHLNILRRAKELCDYLIVGVTTDALCKARKGVCPIINETERMAIVQAIRYVDQVIVQSDMDKLAIVEKLHVNAVFVGSDWYNTEAWIEYEKQFAEVGCVVIYIDYTDGVSSSLLRERLNQH